jgi:hypothetical protein
VAPEQFLSLPQFLVPWGQLYSRAYNATKSCDPEGLIFGDTLVREWAGPMESLIPVAARYVDGLSIQPSGGTSDGAGGSGPGALWNQSDWESLYALVKQTRDMPMILADVGFAFPHPPYRTYEWHEYDSQAAAGAAYGSWVEGSANTTFVLAMNKCQYIDRYGPPQPVLGLKPGMVDFSGFVHEVFASAVKAANARATVTRP